MCCRTTLYEVLTSRFGHDLHNLLTGYQVPSCIQNLCEMDAAKLQSVADKNTDRDAHFLNKLALVMSNSQSSNIFGLCFQPGRLE
jgi:hypothetical protein